MIKYGEIFMCTLIDDDHSCDNSIILRVKGDESCRDIDVDLTGDMCFNDGFKIEDIHDLQDVDTLEEVIDYCVKRRDKCGASITIKHLDKDGRLIVGGSCDRVIGHDLTLSWREE